MTAAESNPVILTYHSIAEGAAPTEISPRTFLEQMAWLKDNARVISLAELAEELERHAGLPDRAVVLTFDDGYLDFLEHAAPVLLRFKFPATVFLPTGFVGRASSWPRAGMEPKPLLSWEQIAELSRAGIVFGSHTVGHVELTSVRGEQLQQELMESCRAIEARTGRPAEFFCYPYGIWNAESRAAVREHFRAACSTGAGLITARSDVFALPRVDAHYVRATERFRSMFTPGFARYVRMRRWIRRLRGQPEGVYAERTAAP